jgi:hypothetical protein
MSSFDLRAQVLADYRGELLPRMAQRVSPGHSSVPYRITLAMVK